MKAKHIMTENPISVSKNDILWFALNVMRSHDIRHLPVMDRGRVKGMISDRDIRSFEVPYDEMVKYPLAAIERFDEPVHRLLEREAITVSPESDLSEVIDVMLTEKVGAVIVVDDCSDELMGIISYVDILGAFQKINSEQLFDSASPMSDTCIEEVEEVRIAWGCAG